VSIDPPNPKVRELGIADHVMKPFRRSQLERALASALTPAADTAEARH
jgi:two-component SAPR family response regulator